MKTICNLLLSILFILHLSAIKAQSGSLDTGFNSGPGIEATIDPKVSAVEVLSDGKILIGGHFDKYNSQTVKHIARLNSNGTLDATFTALGGWLNNSYIYDIAVQSNGKIIIAGYFPSANGGHAILRLNADGTLDPTFTDKSPMHNIINTLALQADGKILIGGKFTAYDGVSRLNLARLNADGTMDTTFNTGGNGPGVVNQTIEEVKSIVVQSDNKILIGGTFTKYKGATQKFLARLNADGSLDNSFNMGSGISGLVSSIALYSNGKIFIGGDFTQYNGFSRYRVARLNADGTCDTSFNPAKFVTVVSTSGTDREVYKVLLQSDGKIFIGGNFSKYNNVIRKGMLRLNADGSADNTFSIGGGIQVSNGDDGDVYDMALQTDAKIVVGGLFAKYNNIARVNLARINGDVSTSNIEKTMDALSVNIYPNPTKERIVLGNIKQATRAILTDLKGCMVRSWLLHEEPYQLELNGLRDGIYLLQVEAENKFSKYKIAIEN